MKGERRKKMNIKGNKGFSLIEVVVVLAIMGVIAAFLTPMLFNYLSESKLRRAQADAGAIAAAIGQFNIDTGLYPIYSALPANNNNATVLVLVTDGNDATIETGAGAWNTGAATVRSTLDKPLHIGVLTDGSTLYNDTTSGVKRPNAWRGPYMSDFKADAWGNKYYVSTEGMKSGVAKAAFVLSAGPDGLITTVLSQVAGTGTAAFSVGGDDIVQRIK